MIVIGEVGLGLRFFGWMGGSVDGWRGGWMNGWVDGWVDGWRVNPIIGNIVLYCLIKLLR